MTQIENKRVFVNLNRLMKIITHKQHEFSSQKMKKHEEEKRIYPVLLDRETGEMHFADKVSGLTPPSFQAAKRTYEHLRPAHLIVYEKNGTVHFEICDEIGTPLTSSDFTTPIAWSAVSETTATLNLLSHKVLKAAQKGLLPEYQILTNEKIRLSLTQESMKQLEKWKGNLSRSQAEMILWDQSIGEYVLRSLDSIAESAVLLIGKNNFISIFQSCLLTIVEPQEKISDFLLIETSRGWTFYQDEVNLPSDARPYYPSIEALIGEIIKKHLQSDR